MLYYTVNNYLQKDIYPFHMPGHKRNASIMPASLLNLDMTEIPGLDNLHNAGGVIRSDQEEIAKIYGADICLFSVNGSSAGITAAICAACGQGEAILMARNSHISAFFGLVFSGMQPVYIYPEETKYGLCGGINPALVKHMLKMHPECGAVFITSPTYEGFVSDIKTISSIAHDHGKLLIVDEAHGAHFPFHGIFPESAIRLGADIVITSPHKTLPALSQTALVLANKGRIDIERLKFFMRACQTSSPSYIIMCTADFSFQSIIHNNDIFNVYIQRLTSARQALAGLSAFSLIGEDIIGTAGIYAIDLSKMLFIALKRMTGIELEYKLAEQFKVQLEMSGNNFALALTSAADTDKGFERLVNGIKVLDTLAVNETEAVAVRRNCLFYRNADCRVSPRTAVFSPWEHTDIYNSLGKISADFICAYPPGIPVLAPGELISSEVIENLVHMNIKQVKTNRDL